MTVFIIILVAIILFLILNKRYVNSYYYQNNCIFENRINKEDIPSELEFINLGSGFARFSFDYSEFEGKGFNFAQSPQCLEYDYKILQQYNKKLKKGCIVCINMPVFIFGFKRYEQLEYCAKYYGRLEKKYIHNYSPILEIICTKFPILIAGKKVFYAIYNKRVDNVWLYDKCTIPVEKIQSYAEGHHASWMKQFSLNNSVDQSVEHLNSSIQYNIQLLKELIDYCLDNGWRPILVSTPLCGSLNKMFSTDFTNNILYKNIKTANEKKIPYFDFREHEAFQNNPDMFWNGVDWVSTIGRKCFMNILQEELRKIDML